ncbi:response regulator [Hahella sp. KA22]|uniref:response regulator n=1 Tax=Hahella sp. KA22 TaxID=1628392 RepID=UPI000FDE094C|nr:response regulator [Hahella sp. KA22]AZZ93880.1 response regulator [Hahella sp. KA22]QAY57253.1 response regulator [Hahella sp. KA22]
MSYADYRLMESSTSHNRRVLVIEDDQDTVDLMRRVLERREVRCQCEFVDNGAKAMFKVHNAHFDLILVDLGLPIASGYEVMQAIRKSDHNRFTPIVVLTESTHERTAIECYKSGASSLISKRMEYGIQDFYDTIYSIFYYWLSKNEFPRTEY